MALRIGPTMFFSWVSTVSFCKFMSSQCSDSDFSSQILLVHLGIGFVLHLPTLASGFCTLRLVRRQVMLSDMQSSLRCEPWVFAECRTNKAKMHLASGFLRLGLLAEFVRSFGLRSMAMRSMAGHLCVSQTSWCTSRWRPVSHPRQSIDSMFCSALGCH